jgi:hypothetical protein
MGRACRLLRPSCAAFALSALVGCSQADIPLAEVTGHITFNGRSTPAEIFFQPEDQQGQLAGRPSTALADDDGEFRLAFTDDRSGAVIGRHRILLKILRRRDGREPRSYNEAVAPLKTVHLEREVKRGRNEFQLAITY